VLDDEEAGRAIVELLADLLADADARLAATGTKLVRFGQVVHDALARQVLWQQLPPVTWPCRGLVFIRLVAWHARSPGAAPLRALAEVQSQRLVEAVPQLLVVLAQLRVPLAQAAHLGEELSHQALQRGHVGRQRGVWVGEQGLHAPSVGHAAAAGQLRGLHGEE
jgi:hypothetical protein